MQAGDYDVVRKAIEVPKLLGEYTEGLKRLGFNPSNGPHDAARYDKEHEVLQKMIELNRALRAEE
jgi:hypothetical protein